MRLCETPASFTLESDTPHSSVGCSVACMSIDAPRERDVEALLRRQVTDAGGLCVKLAPTEAGVPDRLVVWEGRIWLVELKRADGRLRPVQVGWHERAAAAGVDVVVLYGAEGVREWLEELGMWDRYAPTGDGCVRDLCDSLECD